MVAKSLSNNDCFRRESQSKRVEMKGNIPDNRKSPIPCNDIFRLSLKMILSAPKIRMVIINRNSGESWKFLGLS